MKIFQTTAIALSVLFVVGATQANTGSLQPITNGPSSDYFILTHSGGHGGHGGHGRHGHHGWRGHHVHHGWHGGHRGGWGGYYGPGVGLGIYLGSPYYHRTCYWNSFGQYVCTKRFY